MSNAFRDGVLRLAIPVLALISPSISGGQSHTWQGSVEQEQLGLFSAPSTQGRIVASLALGENVGILLKIRIDDEDWCKVRVLTTRSVGYVPCDALKFGKKVISNKATAEPAIPASVSAYAATPASSPTPSPAHEKPSLTNSDVLELNRVGLPGEALVLKIKSSSCNFDTSPSALQQLKLQHVPDAVIMAMLQAPGQQTAARSIVPDTATALPLIATKGAQDLNQLLGKRVIIQRMPLCEPGTYKTLLTYAGTEAEVVSLKPVNLARVSESTLKNLPAETRTLLQDEQKAATISLQVSDGRRLDTCGPVSPNRLPSYLELAAGETIALASLSEGQPQSNSVRAITSQTHLDSRVTDSPVPKVQGFEPSVTTTPNMLQTSGGSSFLSDTEVTSAANGGGSHHFVTLQDQLEALSFIEHNQTSSITLYMPEAVLAREATSAKRQFIQFKPSDEDRRRSLTVVAEGWVGKKITDGCVSITRMILLSDPTGGVVKEAYLSEPLSETWRNNFGATNNCQALRAKFSLDDVQQVQASANNGEFFIAVYAGEIKTKMYRIKRKHQAKLNL